MGRRRKKRPEYCFHISGQAVVRLAGKDFYLGEYDSLESHTKYLSLVAEYQANGLRAPDQPTHQAELPLTIAGLMEDFKTNGMPRLDPSGNRKRVWERLTELLVDEHGPEPAKDFGPRKLEEIRSLFIASGNCRVYANEQTNQIRRIFRWAVSRELVEANQLVALESLEPLKTGEAKDNPPREAVPLEVVESTLDVLDPIVADMVRIQLATGCRPSELFTLTPAEVDRSDPDAWMIRKSDHKTKRHGKRKNIPIVGDIQHVLAKYLLRDTDAVCFTNRKGTPWNKDTYRRHITRRCKDNKLPHWTPYQIRHLIGQTVRNMMTAEHVQATLGHSRINMIETYSDASEIKAIEAANAIQSAVSRKRG